MEKSPLILKCYKALLREYGPQGWWPISSVPKKYHPGDFEFPRNQIEQFEICVGAILTQNTSWIQVEKALENMRVEMEFTPEAIQNLDTEKISELIRPAGYFNQKAKKLKHIASYMKECSFNPDRESLLSVWGVGPETADSILLYAFSKPVFVVDSYTRRIFEKLGLISNQMNYEQIRSLFEKSLPKKVDIYQEYHALIVEHAKNHYSKKPWGVTCFINDRLGLKK